MSKIYKHLFIIIGVGICIYWPLSFFVFGVKNDILTDYFPTRFFISESLNSGYFPFWNPYVNFGVPQYTDMNSGFWNPLTWLIAYLPGYSIYTIQLEVLLYILIGGIGMYFLGRQYRWRGDISVLAAITYMGMGFFTGHIQHLNWVAPAGFLPWCIWSIHLVIKGRSYHYSVFSALLFYMLIASAHPGLIIGAWYFFILLFCMNFYLEIRRYPLEVAFLLKRVLAFAVLLCLMILGILYSYTEVLPYVTHSQKPDMGVFYNSTTHRSWWSFIFSAITNKGSSFFQNEISLRNCYIGLLPFVFFLFGIWANWKRNVFWYFIAVFFLYLSSDLFFVDEVKDFFPLVGFVRLNGAFRLFALISILIAGFDSFQEYINGNSYRPSQLKRFLFIFSILLVPVILYLIYSIVCQNGEINQVDILSSITFSSLGIKRLIETLDFNFFLLISAFFCLIILLTIRYAVIKGKWRWVILIGIIDIFIAVNLQLPYTGVGLQKPKDLQAIISEFPKGLITPLLINLGEYDYGKPQNINVVGHGSYYNKQPGTLIRASQPIIFKSEFEIFSDSSINILKNRPFLYFETENKTPRVYPEMTNFSPNHLTINIANKESGYLVLLYKKYPHWRIKLNQQKIIKEEDNSVFYKIYLPAISSQENVIDFYFDPIWVKFFLGLNCILWMVSLTYLIIFYLKKNSKVNLSVRR
ncbi:MAG: hypothetical protein LC105_01875 [Chitinophagales bacterium]|nr:hypothetical protein [Chitinophagales bacterium]